MDHYAILLVLYMMVLFMLVSCKILYPRWDIKFLKINQMIFNLAKVHIFTPSILNTLKSITGEKPRTSHNLCIIL